MGDLYRPNSSRTSDVSSSRNEETSPRGSMSTFYSLSFAQQRLRFLEQLEPGTSVHHVAEAVHITGALNMTALGQSLNEIIRRHEILRTTVAVIDGQPLQVIAPTLPIQLLVIERREFSKADLTNEFQQPFDLAQAPLVRATLWHLNKEEHILLVTLHRLVSDEYSLEVFMRELVVLYEAFAAGSISPLPELPIQYRDFTADQQQRLQGDMLEEHLAYWKQQLEGAPSLLELPTDRPRPAKQTHRGARQSVVLPERLTQALRELSRQEGSTLFMTLLASFQVLLHRYTGQEDIVIGTPVVNREQTADRALIGPLSNTLVLRTDLSGNPTFRELLHRVREAVMGAYGHQELPFEKLVEELQPQRNLSHTPLFQVMFAFQNRLRQSLHLPGLVLAPLEVAGGTATFDVTLLMSEEANRLMGTLEYNTDLFDNATISRMLGHFQTLLEGIVAESDQQLWNLPLLTEAERHQVLVEWNATQAYYPEEVCLPQLIEAQVERTPDTVAVVFEDQQLTYRALNARANQLAHHLQRLGVGPEVLVGICMERSVDMVVGLLGIVKTGGVYVPLDPAYPKERLAFMLEDSQAAVLVTQQALLEKLPEHGAQVVCLDTGWAAIAHEPEENPVSGTTADNLAYVIYTSGSTGKPKGAMNTHRGICNRLLWMQDAYQLTAADRVLQKAPYSFDVSVWEFFWPLLTGARLIVARPGGHHDSAYLVDLIVAQGITVLHFVPSMLKLFLEAQRLESCDSLRQVMCGGETLPAEIQKRFFNRLKAQLHNFYGPTEAAIGVSSWACQPQDEHRTVPIGRPIANTQLYILDAYLQPVPIGISGELHIGGIALARGYLNRPELTLERFIANPFSDDPKARLYKTGDLARYWPDGTIEFLGRLDHQVKIRGFRIELEEIEVVLAQHPSVREAVVLARQDVPEDRRLVAYVVPHQKLVPSPADVRRFVKEKLPEYMVPAAFTFLDVLPLTLSGKVDRLALPAPDTVRSELGAAFVSPQTELQRFLTTMWQDILRVEMVGIDDNFFELGGDSIKGAMFINRLQEILDEVVYVVALFDAPTIAEFAAYLDTHYQETVTQLFDAETLRHIEPGKRSTWIEEIDASTVEQEEIARMMAEIEALSDEEVRRLLANEGS